MTETKSQTIDLTQFEGHTPGLWGCVPTSNHAHDYRLTKPQGLPLPYSAEGNDHSEQRANARLIAAAPDLLAAYKAALARAEAAEAEVKRLRDELQVERALSVFHRGEMLKQRERAVTAERQRDEARTAGAEAMREALLGKVDFSEVGFDYVSHGTIRALPIPAQERK
jgi:hypothetical protein